MQAAFLFATHQALRFVKHIIGCECENYFQHIFVILTKAYHERGNHK